jgi:hypothetical protein
VASKGGVVLVVLLDEVSDFASLELLFEMEKLLEIEAAGDCEESGGRDAVGVEDLDGGHI